jgi:hypothetical protein
MPSAGPGRGCRGPAAPLALPLLLALAAAGCRSTPPEPPAWVNAPPTEPEYLYGIGSYVGALHAEDNHGYAMEQARAMLSRNLQSRVVNTIDLRETEATSRLRSESLVSSDFVVQNSELVATWVDAHGQTGRRGTVWVLMRIPRP